MYQLFLDATLVYIGKTDAEAGLNKRLSRHYSKIQQRQNLEPSRISFKAVRVYVFTAVDLEAQLIKFYNATSAVEWNQSGFGSNDPGRQRDTTRYKEGHFDLAYPIDIDRELGLVIGSNVPAYEILNAIKQRVPYTFRFELAGRGARRAHADLEKPIQIDVVALAPLTARAVLKEVVRQLPAGWQATKLPSTLILYKERRAYDQGEIIARSSDA